MEVLERHFIRFLIGAGREREELGKVRKYKLQKTKNKLIIRLRKKLGKSTHARQANCFRNSHLKYINYIKVFFV